MNGQTQYWKRIPTCTLRFPFISATPAILRAPVRSQEAPMYCFRTRKSVNIAIHDMIPILRMRWPNQRLQSSGLLPQACLT